MSRQYLGWPCPHCGERKLDLGCVTIDTNPAVLGIECKACGKSGGIYENDPALLLDRENRELEAIVRTLAEEDPIRTRQGLRWDTYECRFCNGGSREYDDAEHEIDHCLWLRARKAMEKA